MDNSGKINLALVERNEELLETFFRDVLGVDAEQAEIDACKVEHLLSIDTSMKLARLVEYVNSGKKAVRDFLRELRETKSACAPEAEQR